MKKHLKTAVVIPCYKVANEIEGVVESVPDFIDLIYCVDDCCPDRSTAVIEDRYTADERVKVIKRNTNGGVGAAVITGYRKALEDGVDVVVKVDGDGQMDCSLIPLFINEIANGRADYVKGNRFYDLESARSMPMIRKTGNMGLSFMTKLSTGYWRIFDPTNGYTAIHINLLKVLPLEKIEKRYFFESDMLFYLGLARARVLDIPMDAVYGDEESNLSVTQTLFSFPIKHARNLLRRIIYDHFIRNFSLASLELFFGTLFLLFGIIFGLLAWGQTIQTGQPATAGTVMLASLPTILGFQFILNFFAFDMANEPMISIHDRLGRGRT